MSDMIGLLDALGSTLLIVSELTVRILCVLMHYLRWTASGSRIECVTATLRCDDFNFNQLANISFNTAAAGGLTTEFNIEINYHHVHLYTVQYDFSEL